MNKKLILSGVILAGTLLPIVIVGFFSIRKSEFISTFIYTPFATDIEQAVHLANLAQNDDYANGEVAVEGHVILGSEAKEKITTVYVVSSWGWFGFENGIFTMGSGAFQIPTVIVFSQNDRGEYMVQEYREAMDGSLYGPSIEKMFPARYFKKVIDKNSYNDELHRQMEVQAAEYLKRIGRVARVSVPYVEKKILTDAGIDVQASNTLFEIISNNAQMNDFPYWLGTVERIEDGTRYIYETSQDKSTDGHDLVIYIKKKENGTVVATYVYKVVGTEVLLQ